MTLTETARITKTIILIGAVLFVVSVSGWISFQFWYYRYYLPNKPPVEIPPEIKFGILPKPIFPLTSVSSSNYSYSLDTETGELPKDIPKLAKVFFIPQLGTTLLAPNKARNLATSLSFENGPQTPSPTIYKFSDNLGGELTIDINSGNFSFNKPIATPSATLTEIPDESNIIDSFKNFLSTRSLLKSSLQEGRVQVSYDNFSKKESRSAQISLWPEDIESLKIVTPTFQKGLIQATLSATKGGYDYTNLSYIFWEPDQQNSSTYLLKSVDLAFNDLKGGRGHVIIEPKTARASISLVYLAYYEPFEYSQYLQPIYVFEGDDFIGYVPALSDQYLEE